MFTAKREESKREGKVHIRCYLDFDGTLTGMGGSEAVSSNLYNTLLVPNPLLTENKNRYATDSFIERETMLKTMRDGFEKNENKDMKMLPKAIQFLLEMIKKEAEIIIISKNRKEYITAVLEVAGFNPGQIAKITVYDVDDMQRQQSKGKIVLNHENEKKQKADVVVCCDDNGQDFTSMNSALYDADYTEKSGNIISRYLKTGQFPLEVITEELSKTTAQRMQAWQSLQATIPEGLRGSPPPSRRG